MPIQLNNLQINRREETCDKAKVKKVKKEFVDFYSVAFSGNLSVVNKLPLKIQKSRNEIINQTIDYISSSDFLNKQIVKLEMAGSEYVEKMSTLSKNKKFLRQRADKLLNCANVELLKSTSDTKPIIIGWSGGRDSSAITAALMELFPQGNYKLITIINGTSSNIENPSIQFENLRNLIDPSKKININLYYVDRIADTRKNVLNSALEDSQILGKPAICSACKMIMDKTFVQVAKKIGAERIITGNAKYQGLQNFLEQTPKQIEFMKSILNGTKVLVEHPMYSHFEYPFDSMLLLSSLGVERNMHKLEMKCHAGGLNSKSLNNDRLNTFLINKHIQTSCITGRSVNILDSVEGINLSELKSNIDETDRIRRIFDFEYG